MARKKVNLNVNEIKIVWETEPTGNPVFCKVELMKLERKITKGRMGYSEKKVFEKNIIYTPRKEALLSRIFRGSKPVNFDIIKAKILIQWEQGRPIKTIC